MIVVVGAVGWQRGNAGGNARCKFPSRAVRLLQRPQGGCCQHPSSTDMHKVSMALALSSLKRSGWTWCHAQVRLSGNMVTLQ